VRITQVQKQVAMDEFRAGVAAAQHPIQPSGKIGVFIFPAHFCRDRRTKLRIAMNAREFVSSISGDRMRPNHVRLPENFLFPEGASKPDLDALKTAKARQDVSYQKLDTWIAAAIAELSDEKRFARQQPPVGRASPRKARAR
jgi:hypothetical protein